MSGIRPDQSAMARRFGVQPVPADPRDKLGISRNISDGIEPLNALRHRPEVGTSGWFVWAGQELSSEDDFFVPLHVAHVAEVCPRIVPYLALPPGWRVLLAPGYEDVWFDEDLLCEAGDA